MRKIIAILLSLALLLGCAAGLAEDAEKQIFGTIRSHGEFTLTGILPDGYRIVPFELSDDAILSRIVSDDPTQPQMVLSIAYDETYAGVERLNDADDETLAMLEKTFTDTDPFADITYDETAYGTRLLVCRTQTETSDSLVFLSIYDGYFVEFAMLPGEEAAEQKLTDEQVANCNAFLTGLDFVAGAVEQELKIAGKTFTANITGFDADAKTIDVTLLTPFTMTEWEMIKIEVGDTVRIGTQDVLVETLEYDGYEGGTSVINDEYYLRPADDGYYHASFYESTVMLTAKEMTLSVPDSLVFAEEIDPETGEILEEEKMLTADDLFAALAAAKDGGVAFDSENISITFDENEEPVKIERFYVPWQ